MVYGWCFPGEFDKLRSPFEWDLISRSLTLMAIEGFVFFTCTVFIEYIGTCKRRLVLGIVLTIST